MTKQHLIKSIIVIGIFGFLLIGIFSSCEDDAILELESEEECVGSYCRFALPNAEEVTVPLEAVQNPDEF